LNEKKVTKVAQKPLKSIVLKYLLQNTALKIGTSSKKCNEYQSVFFQF
jgi:hypothetical protein